MFPLFQIEIENELLFKKIFMNSSASLFSYCTSLLHACSGLNRSHSEDRSRSHFLETANVILIWKKDLCRCIEVKDLKKKSPWINQLSPKSNKCPHERHTGRKGHVNSEIEIGVM